MSLPLLLSNLEYASFLVYSPKGNTEVSKKSRSVIRDGVKKDHPDIIEKIVKELCKNQDQFPQWFGSSVSLVPVPRSAPFPRRPHVTPEMSLWPSKRICEEMIKAGLAHEILPNLERTKLIKKSAYSQKGERPSLKDHFATLAWKGVPLKKGTSILVVDDFITIGRTMLAAASHVKHVFPNSIVRGFALVRTMGFIPEIEQIKDPCIGTLTYQNNAVNRKP